MSKDLELIELLEKEIGKELVELPYEESETELKAGYSVDGEGRVTSLKLDESLAGPFPVVSFKFHSMQKAAFPSVLFEFKHLTKLSLYGCGLSDVTLLSKLTGLKILNLRNNRLTAVSFITSLPCLTNLNLSRNQLTDVSPLSSLTELTSLNLSSNKLTDVSSLSPLTRLMSLDVSYNELTDVSSLSSLTGLTSLNLGGNKLTDVSSLSSLSGLSTLILGGNKLTDVSSLSFLSGLTNLNLGTNKLTDVSYLSSLTRLNKLSLRNNNISKLPEALFRKNMSILTNSKNTFWVEHFILDITGNPIVSPPINILNQGYKAIKYYFESLKESPIPLNEVKVLLVGDGGAGKTSLIKRILGKKFDLNEEQTHGININYHPINNIKTRIWDFGGQEIMHATHQFFLSKRSLYILVLDGRKEENPQYWLKLIQSFGGDSPVLVVLNKIDQNPGFEVNCKALKEKYKNIIGFHRISCKEGTDIDHFKTAMETALTQVEMSNITWPGNWFNVKQNLESMKENFITLDRYRTICTDNSIPEQEIQDTLVEFLNDLGVIIRFIDFHLCDTHVLRPEWVTGAVYKIINFPHLSESGGVLQLEELKAILKKKTKKDQHYPHNKYKYIIDLMRKFELCYTVQEEKSMLIPDRLPVKEPDFDFDEEGALKFVIDYDFLPRSVIPRFIVRLHKEIKNSFCWRSGVFLENPQFHSQAVVKADYMDRRITIMVQGLQKRDYFASLLQHLRAINNSFEKMETWERVPMPDDHKNTASYMQLIKMEQNGIDTYIPEKSDKVYKVKELLGTIETDINTELLKDQLRDLYKEFIDLSTGTTADPQSRGYQLERLLKGLFDLFNLKPRGSFRNTGEQIDGSFQSGLHIFLVEAKWHINPTGQRDLSAFSSTVKRRARGTRGLFISINGFSADGLTAFKSGNPTAIICMDGNDLESILKGKHPLPDAISLKLRHAAETNECFAPLEDLIKKYR